MAVAVTACPDGGGPGVPHSLPPGRTGGSPAASARVHGTVLLAPYWASQKIKSDVFIPSQCGARHALCTTSRSAAHSRARPPATAARRTPRNPIAMVRSPRGAADGDDGGSLVSCRHRGRSTLTLSTPPPRCAHPAVMYTIIFFMKRISEKSYTLKCRSSPGMRRPAGLL